MSDTAEPAPTEAPAPSPPPRPARSLTRFLREHRAHVIRIATELVIVFVGVTAAFALENWRSNAAEEKYRRQMITALSQSIERLNAHNHEIETMIAAQTLAFDTALKEGKRPAPPVYREQGAERPPKVWEGIVATGVARSLPPDLYFQLFEHFNRVDSFGDRYARYALFTENSVLPNLKGDDTSAFYTPDGELRGEYREYVNRLRDLAELSVQISRNADVVREKLDREVAR